MNDTIYRRDAIQALIDTEEIKGFAYRMLEDRLMEIPSVDQQQVDGAALISAMSLGYSYGIKANRPQGEWIRREYWSEGVGMGESYGFYYECSNCGEQQKGGYDNCGINYCPDCGAKMRGNRNE